MDDGLKRAFAATARTRADASLTPEMRRFLECLAPFTEPQTHGKIGCVATRAQDRARQARKRFGYAEYARREDGKGGWQILRLGRQMLAAPSVSPVNGRGNEHSRTHPHGQGRYRHAGR